MVGKSQIIFLTFAEPPASLKIFFCRLPNSRQVPKSFFAVCRTAGKSQNIFLPFAEPPASPKIFFCRLPNSRQVPKSFFSVCRTAGKSQNIFLPFAEPPASLKFIFRSLLKLRRRGGACVPARTSAQRRFHPKKRC